MGQYIPEEIISMINLLDENSLDKIVGERRSTAFERIRYIWNRQCRYSRSIHNCTVCQNDHRHNHTRFTLFTIAGST
jgi:hypothetical protein